MNIDYFKLSQKILKAFQNKSNSLEINILKQFCQNLLITAYEKQNVQVVAQPPLHINHEGKPFKDYFEELVLNSRQYKHLKNRDLN